MHVELELPQVLAREARDRLELDYSTGAILGREHVVGAARAHLLALT
jgi:hypothetical protein